MLQTYEYKVVPAPAKGRKGPGIKGTEGKFAYGLEAAINMMAADGWDYLRAETLPSEERQGLTSSQTVFRSVLIFRRALAKVTDTETGLAPTEQPAPIAEPAAHQPADDVTTDYSPEPAPAEATEDHIPDEAPEDLRSDQNKE